MKNRFFNFLKVFFSKTIRRKLRSPNPPLQFSPLPDSALEHLPDGPSWCPPHSLRSRQTQLQARHGFIADYFFYTSSSIRSRYALLAKKEVSEEQARLRCRLQSREYDRFTSPASHAAPARIATNFCHSFFSCGEVPEEPQGLGPGNSAASSPQPSAAQLRI